MGLGRYRRTPTRCSAGYHRLDQSRLWHCTEPAGVYWMPPTQPAGVTRGCGLLCAPGIPAVQGLWALVCAVSALPLPDHDGDGVDDPCAAVVRPTGRAPTAREARPPAHASLSAVPASDVAEAEVPIEVDQSAGPDDFRHSRTRAARTVAECPSSSKLGRDEAAGADAGSTTRAVAPRDCWTRTDRAIRRAPRRVPFVRGEGTRASQVED